MFSSEGKVVMKKIMLCCAAGMSTSMLVQKMRAEAEKRALAVEINAYPVAEIESMLPQADVVLLGPQVQFELSRLRELSAPLGKPVEVIDMMDYGTMRGDRVLDKAIQLMA
jgi:PTS system cellobiose-specific IIB component